MLSEVEVLSLLLFVPHHKRMPLQNEERVSTIQIKKYKLRVNRGYGICHKIKFVPKFKFCHSVGNLTQ